LISSSLRAFQFSLRLAAPLYQQVDLYGASKRLNWKARSDELIKAYDMSIK